MLKVSRYCHPLSCLSSMEPVCWLNPSELRNAEMFYLTIGIHIFYNVIIVQSVWKTPRGQLMTANRRTIYKYCHPLSCLSSMETVCWLNPSELRNAEMFYLTIGIHIFYNVIIVQSVWKTPRGQLMTANRRTIYKYCHPLSCLSSMETVCWLNPSELRNAEMFYLTIGIHIFYNVIIVQSVWKTPRGQLMTANRRTTYKYNWLLTINTLWLDRKHFIYHVYYSWNSKPRVFYRQY